MGKKSRTVRVVLDTNTLVSALGWNGAERELLKDCLRGEYELCISEQILEEVSRVLDYEKFSFIEEAEKAHFTDLLNRAAHIAEPKESLDIIKEDPPTPIEAYATDPPFYEE